MMHDWPRNDEVFWHAADPDALAEGFWYAEDGFRAEVEVRDGGWVWDIEGRGKVWFSGGSYPTADLAARDCLHVLRDFAQEGFDE